MLQSFWLADFDVADPLEAEPPHLKSHWLSWPDLTALLTSPWQSWQAAFVSMKLTASSNMEMVSMLESESYYYWLSWSLAVFLALAAQTVLLSNQNPRTERPCGALAALGEEAAEAATAVAAAEEASKSLHSP